MRRTLPPVYTLGEGPARHSWLTVLGAATGGHARGPPARPRDPRAHPRPDRRRGRGPVRHRGNRRRPRQPAGAGALIGSASPGTGPAPDEGAPAYEVQELKVNLGDQVQAGQTLCLLANHRDLFIEGQGFKGEAGLLERAARKGWAVEAEFAEDPAGQWTDPLPPLAIRHLANSIDPASRTLAF
jgi:hypothetical protein